MKELLAIAIVVGVFFLCREVVCWYWKLNEILRELQETRKILVELLAAVKGQE